MKTFNSILIALVVVLFLLFPSGSFAQSMGCTNFGESKHIDTGLYYVNTNEGYRLYHLSKRGDKPRLLEKSGTWNNTWSVTSLKNWLYIVQEGGKLHRVNPQTGEAFPKNFDTGDCIWYINWNWPVWAEDGKLYAVLTNDLAKAKECISSAQGEKVLVRITDYKKRKCEIIRPYNLPANSISPSLSTEVH